MKKILVSLLIILIVFSNIPVASAGTSPNVIMTISGPSKVVVGEYCYYSVEVTLWDMAFAYMSLSGLDGCLSGTENKSWNTLSSSTSNTFGNAYVNTFVKAIDDGRGVIFFTLAGCYYDSNGTLQDYSCNKSFYVTVEPKFIPTPMPTTVPTATPTQYIFPTWDPTPNPSSNPTATPTTNPTAKPTSKPTARPTSKPADNNSTDPTSKPAEKNSTDSTTNPTEQATATPIPEKPNDWEQAKYIVQNAKEEHVNITLTQSQTIPKSLLEELKAQNKKLTIDFGSYQCTLDGYNMDTIDGDIDLSFNFDKNGTLSLAFNKMDVYQLHFDHSGELPCPIEYTFQATGRKAGDELYLYYMNEQLAQIEAVQKVIVDNVGNITFQVDHFSSYVICDGIVEGAVGNDTLLQSAEPATSPNIATAVPEISPTTEIIDDLENDIPPSTEMGIRLPKIPTGTFFLILLIFILLNAGASVIILLRHKKNVKEKSL